MRFLQDLWRALLVFVVSTILLERYCPPRLAPPSVVTYAPPPSVQTYAPPPVPAMQAQAPAWQAQAPQVYIAPAQPERPLRRVAQSFLDLGDSVIGVIR